MLRMFRNKTSLLTGAKQTGNPKSDATDVEGASAALPTSEIEMSPIGHTRLIAISVDDAAGRALMNAANAITSGLGPEQLSDSLVDQYTNDMSIAWRQCLPAGAMAEISSFSKDPNCSIMTIDQIPLHSAVDLPPTPLSGFDRSTELAVRAFDAVLISLMNLAGLMPVANTSENEGRLVRNVVPGIGSETETSSHGSTVSLGYHNDQPNYALNRDLPFASFPDALSFIGLKNPQNIPTDIICIEEVMDQLSFRTVRLLTERAYRFQGPASTAVTPYSPVREHEPLLTETSPGRFFIRFDPNVVEVSAADKKYSSALIELKEVLENSPPSVSLALQPGQLLIFKNRRVLHQRRAFKRIKEIEHARWFRRVYGVVQSGGPSEANRSVNWL